MHNISEKTIVQNSDSVQNSSKNVQRVLLWLLFICFFLEEKNNREDHVLETFFPMTNFQRPFSSASEEFCY